MKKKELLFIIFIILLSVFGVKALFYPGFYTSHDGRHQIIRLMHFHQGLKDGQFPVRWAGTALSGYGYPLFVFTYRLPFWISEGWYLLSSNLGDAVKFCFIVTFIASGLTMYYFAKEIWESKLAGLLSAVLYLWAPYRFLNIFVRASLGEAVFFAFIPLLFLGVWKISKKQPKAGQLLVIFSLTSLILSHALVLSIWFIPVAGWYLVNYFYTADKKEYLSINLRSVFLSLLLTVYYWLPAALERKYTYFSGSIGNYFKDHFVSLRQLIYSRWGYGFSMPGVENDMMSFQVGISHWLIVLLTVLVVLRVLVFKKKQSKGLLSQQLFFLAVFFLSLFFMLPISSFFYRTINNFFVIDIPWRFLGVSVFSASVLAGGVLKYSINQKLKFFILAVIILLSLYGNRNHLRVNKYLFYPEKEYWQSTETSNQYNDYAPRWFSLSKFDQKDPQFELLKGEADFNLLQRKSNLFAFKSKVNSDRAEIALKVAYYPGWKTFVNGEQTKTIYKEDGRIKVILDKGVYDVVLRFEETNLRKFCNYLSLLTAVFLVVKLNLRKTKKVITRA